jgi:hypothetical protein
MEKVFLESEDYDAIRFNNPAVDSFTVDALSSFLAYY